MSKQISRATIAFSCLGHLYIHLCTAFFFIIVLSLETVWQRHQGLAGEGLFGIGLLVVTVYAAAAFALIAVFAALMLPRDRAIPAPLPAGGD